MPLTSEEYIKQLSVELGKLGGMLPLGFEYVRLTGQSPHPGGVDYMGQTATRAMYADLWAWLNENKPDAIVSESEWQAMFASQNGNVPYYSTGDGSTTFRFPRVVGYFKGAGAVSEVGKYVKEGLPNIAGTFDLINHNPDLHGYTGAFDKATIGTMPVTGLMQGANWNEGWGMVTERFSASLSNPIYGNSPHVTPETVTVVMGVIAFGSVASIGTATEEGIVAELGEHGAKLGEHGAKLGELEGVVEGKADAGVVEGMQSGSGFTEEGKAEIVGWGMPDYSAGVSVAKGNFTAPTNGILIAWGSYTSSHSFYVDVGSARLSYDYETNFSTRVLLGAGTVVSLTGTASPTIIFYPLKGA